MANLRQITHTRGTNQVIQRADAMYHSAKRGYGLAEALGLGEQLEHGAPFWSY